MKVPRRGSENSKTFVVVSLVSFIVAIGLLVGISWVRNRGYWVYVMDDSYIHMAMARTLADNQEWGPVPGGYEAASSSPELPPFGGGATRARRRRLPRSRLCCRPGGGRCGGAPNVTPGAGGPVSGRGSCPADCDGADQPRP